jgi:ATP-dependent DNA ligase
MTENFKDVQAAAAEYKRRVAGTFMLVDGGKDIKAKLSGSDFCVTRKIDGVMAYAVVRDGEAMVSGTGGRDLSGVPCAKALAAAVAAAGLKSATVAAELYAPAEKGRPRVGDVQSALADPAKAAGLRMAPFDLVEADGEPFRPAHYKETHAKLCTIFKDEAVRPVEMRTADSEGGVAEIYAEWVEEGGAEGLVVHSEVPVVWKIKPRHSVDAAVVGFTTGDNGVRDLMFAVRHGDGKYQVFCVSGNGLGDDLKRSLAGRLGAAAAESGFVQTDSRGIAFQMVRPEMVCEVSFGDLVAEDSRGRAKTNPLLEFDGGAWKPCGRTPGVAAQAAVIERFRDDKGIEPPDIRVEQLSQICPFAEREEAAELPKSTLLKRKVFKKTSKDKVMLQKFVAWKTNKEADPRYPAYVFHYTDFSSGRKDPLKKDIRVAATEEQINAIFDVFVAENVKKGWTEIP